VVVFVVDLRAGRVISLTLPLRALLLNPARPGRLTRWLDRSGFNKRPAVATTLPNPGDPAGRPRTQTNPDETRFVCFFSFKCVI